MAVEPPLFFSILSPYFIVYNKKINKGSEDPYLCRMGGYYPPCLSNDNPNLLRLFVRFCLDVYKQINFTHLFCKIFNCGVNFVLVYCKFFHISSLQTILLNEWVITLFLIVLYHMVIEKSSIFRIYFHAGSYIISLFLKNIYYISN